MRTKEEAIAQFTPNKLSEEKITQVNTIQEYFGHLVDKIWDQVPDGPHKTAGMRKLLEAKHTLVQAVSHS